MQFNRLWLSFWEYFKSKAYVDKPNSVAGLMNEIRQIDLTICRNVNEIFVERNRSCSPSMSGHLTDIIFDLQSNVNLIILKHTSFKCKKWLIFI